MSHTKYISSSLCGFGGRTFRFSLYAYKENQYEDFVIYYTMSLTFDSKFKMGSSTSHDLLLVKFEDFIINSLRDKQHKLF